MERCVIGVLFKGHGATNVQRFCVRKMKSLDVVVFYTCVCLIIETLKFSATSELRVFNADLNRSSWRIKGPPRQG